MKNIVLGLLAHVDAGKTTLSEALLYRSNTIRAMGRVDSQNAFLDSYEIEKERGITVFSKQAQMDYEDIHVTLVDTPGHVDFSAEMERTLQILDYAVLVISGSDGVTGYTVTLWNLLKKYDIPVFIFVNKTDMAGFNKKVIFAEIRKRLSDSVVDFTLEGESFLEEVAANSEKLLEDYFENGNLTDEAIAEAVAEKKLYPCFFGSALRLEGIEKLLSGIRDYTVQKYYPDEFAARIYKVTYDDRGERLTFMKITGGVLKSKSMISGREWEEKANLIRIYSGSKYSLINEAAAGCVCAVTGLSMSHAGEALGGELFSYKPTLEPVLSYTVIPEENVNVYELYNKLSRISDEIPELNLSWDEVHKSIIVSVMGEVQTEIFIRMVKENLGVNVSLGPGKIIYHETIADTVIGVGHFEPLRHYAEVCLRLEPAKRGTGLAFSTECSEDVLDRNWQRLIIQNLGEKNHKGVLIGAGITDMKITVIAGRAHSKHTEGGDFRKAVYRAVRQGLMQAENVILEPVYNFRIEADAYSTGKIMTDILNMQGQLNPVEVDWEMNIISGTAPVAKLHGYAGKIAEITHGKGTFSVSNGGYAPCHNTEEVIESYGYDPLSDVKNTPDSVFCSHGSGIVVPWNEVFSHMHCELEIPKQVEYAKPVNMLPLENRIDEALGTEEIDRIIARSGSANRDSKSSAHQGMYKKLHTSLYPKVKSVSVKKNLNKYTIVDGYNVIFAWEDLAELAGTNIDAARDKLLHYMCDYQAMIKEELIVVFDAYRVKGRSTEFFDYNNIHVVYTKEAETADRYIERFAYDNKGKYDITVVTSDGLEQIIIRGEGAKLISSRELEKIFVKLRENLINEHTLQNGNTEKIYLKELLEKIETEE